VQQCVWNVEIVLQHQVTHAHLRLSGTKRDRGASRHRNSPEQSTGVGVDTGVKVVNLGSEIYEVILTSIEVKSDQGERTMVDGSVNTHIDPAHEAHVGIKEEFFRSPVGIGRGSSALDKGHAHFAIQVIDR